MFRGLFRFAAVLIAASLRLSAQADIVADFNSTLNAAANSGFSYGSGLSPSEFTPLIPFVPVNVAGALPCGTLFVCLNTGLPFPQEANIEWNGTGATVSGQTIIQPDTILRLDPQGAGAIVRFTAPISGVYSTTGAFQGIDSVMHSTKVSVYTNGSSAFTSVISSYGQVIPFSLTNIALAAGQSLDFVVVSNNPGDASYLSTGLTGIIQGGVCSSQLSTEKVAPSVGGNAGQITVQIAGCALTSSSQIRLTGLGSDIAATNVVSSSSASVGATFDLKGSAPGPRNLVVVNPDGTSATLMNAFSIQAGGAPDIRLSKIGSVPVPGFSEDFYITVTNVGSIDSGEVPIVEFLEPWFTLTSAQPSPTEVDQAPAVFPPSAIGTDYNAFIEWKIPTIAAGASQILTYRVTLDPAFPIGQTCAGTVCTADVDTVVKRCEVIEAACYAATIASCSAGPEVCIPFAEACHVGALSCVAAAGGICISDIVEALGSRDPNDLIGPSGSGAQDWVGGTQYIPYAILFENLPAATKSATNIGVLDVFDPATFDLTTLIVSSVAFANSVYTPSALPLAIQPLTADIDLRPAQNLIVRANLNLNVGNGTMSVNLTSIDPATGLPPSDPLQGFLPPGIGGRIVISVSPRNTLTTGTQVTDQASIVFDKNAPLSTPIWANTIDNSNPASKVAPLTAAENSPSFPVTWVGSDVGSGIQSYSIFVSDNSGAFAAWQTNTAATSATYIGVPGHTYGFYSIATDLVGNVEAPKTNAEATTTVQVSSACSTDVSSQLKITRGGFSYNHAAKSFVQALSLTNNGASLTGASLVLDSLSVAATLNGAGGNTVCAAPLGSPWISIPGTLATGQSISLTLTFSDPTQAGIQYSTRVLAGNGQQ